MSSELEFKQRIVIYDLEVTKYCFIYGDYDTLNNKFNTFVLSRYRDDRIALKEYLFNLINSKSYQVAFNNLNYDYPMLDYLIKRMKLKKWDTMSVEEILKGLMEKNSILIPDKKTKRNNKFGKNYNIIHKPLIKQIDLFKIHHFDNKSRMTSLKKCEINMRFSNVEDFDWNRFNTEGYTKTLEQELIDYNLNDVKATKELYYLTRGQLDKVTVNFPGMTKYYNADRIKYRINVSKKYNMINAINYSDVKIGEELNRINYLKKTKKNWYKIKNKKTFREHVYIKNIIPLYIRDLFKDKELKVLLDILDDIIIDVNNPKFSHQFIYKGMKISFGLGGLHHATNQGYIQEASEGDNYDERDVGSEYPQAIITLGVYPAHLGPEWNDMIKESFDRRIMLKKKKEKTDDEKLEINTLKLAMNGGGYGKLKDKYSWQYDPLQTYRVTIKCQLDLLLYIQMLYKEVPNIILESINTDSVNILYNKKYLETVNNIDIQWKNITGAVMEQTEYKKLIRADVNNYMVILKNGKVKYKGIFEMEKELHKDHSFHIINQALSNYFIKGTSVRETVMNGKSIYDYLGTIKVQGTKSGTWTLYHSFIKKGVYYKEKLQKINRYYITNNESSIIIKENDDNPEKWSYIEAGYNTFPLNKVISEDISDYDINYNWYISKTNKIINQIEQKRYEIKF